MTQAAENSGGADQPLTAGASFKVSATDDALCPLCQYNLRGLQEPRCPECGYRFTWEEVLDPSRRLHPYLYEHRPDAGPLALWNTLRGGLRPAKFWATLHPVQPSRPLRLL